MRRLFHGIGSGIVPLTLVAVALVAALFGDAATQQLRYEREAILAGEWWRLLTGHVVHLGWGHLGANAAGVLLVWYVAGRALGLGRWLALVLTVSLGTGIALLLLNPGLDWYVGLSGMLHGLFVAVIIERYLTTDRIEATVLAVLFGAKLLWEQSVGPLPGSIETAGGNVIVDAHLYGAVCGMLFQAGRELTRSRR